MKNSTRIQNSFSVAIYKCFCCVIIYFEIYRTIDVKIYKGMFMIHKTIVSILLCDFKTFSLTLMGGYLKIK
jgi:hypothetical protein